MGAPEVGPGGLALAAIAPGIVRDRRRAMPSCSWPDTHYHDKGDPAANTYNRFRLPLATAGPPTDTASLATTATSSLLLLLL